MSSTEYFYEITPDRVIEAVESAGLICTGRCMALNSFENRVYDVELDPECLTLPDGVSPKQMPQAFFRRIAKFYRPGRWSLEQLKEEHLFLEDLKNAEIPVIAPLPFPDGSTLRQAGNTGIWYALFPKVGGRAPEELTEEQLQRVGRLLGRIHAIGSKREAPHRIRLDPATYGKANLQFLLQGNWIAQDSRDRYQAAVEKILESIEPWFADLKYQRIHGDCHLGNLLWNQEGPFFLDFDDMVRGPAVQDLWLMIPGRDEASRQKIEWLLEGYDQMHSFDRSTLKLIEPLRALRFVHYSAWVARRWQDPAFPAAFPHFGTPRYWAEMTQDLEEQLRLILMSNGRNIIPGADFD